MRRVVVVAAVVEDTLGSAAILPHEVHQLMQLRWDITPCAGELSDPRWTKTPKDLLREERRGHETTGKIVWTRAAHMCGEATGLLACVG
jgi:hypothetical protein